MLLFHRKREVCSSVCATNDFRKEEPLHERRPIRRFFRKIGRFFGRVGLGITLAAGVGTNIGCGDKAGSAQMGQQEATTAGGTTNADGSISFETSGGRFSVTVLDSETGNPIQGLVVLFAARNNQGVYVILDPNNVYFGRAVAAENSADFSNRREGSGETSTTVLLQNSNSVCREAVRYALQGRSPEEWANEDRNDRNSLLNTLFERKKKDVNLSELNNALRQLIDLAVDYGGGELIERLIRAHIKLSTMGSAAINILGLALTELDACTAKETLVWGNFYRSFCYEENDQFEIWQLRNSIPEITIPGLDITLLSNPFFIVIPKNNRENWEAPTATIDGNVIVTDAADRFLRPPIQVAVTHTDRRIPSLVDSVRYGRDGVGGGFSFQVGACENYNPTYDVGIKHTKLLLLYPKTTLGVLDGEMYNVIFYLDEECETDQTREAYTFYRDRDEDGYGSRYDLAVSCEDVPGYIDRGGDCDDKNPMSNPEMSELCVTFSECRQLIIADSSRIVPHVDISGDVVVFHDFDEVERTGFAYYMDIKTQARTAIPTVYNRGSSEPKIWEDNILFKENFDFNWSLYNLTTDEPVVFHVSGSVPSRYHAQINRDRILFYPSDYSLDRRFSLYNIDGRFITTLEPDIASGTSTMPTFFGSRIAISDAGQRILVYDLEKSNGWTDITSDYVAFAHSPTLYEDLMVFASTRNGKLEDLDRSDLYAYDFTTEEFWRITEGLAVVQPRLWGEYVATLTNHVSGELRVALVNVNSGAIRNLFVAETGAIEALAMDGNRVVFAYEPEIPDVYRYGLMLCEFEE